MTKQTIKDFLVEHVKAGDRVVDGSVEYYVCGRKVLFLQPQHGEVCLEGYEFNTLAAPEIWRRVKNITMGTTAHDYDTKQETWQRIASYPAKKERSENALEKLERVVGEMVKEKNWNAEGFLDEFVKRIDKP